MIRRGDVLLSGESLWRVLMRLRHAASPLQVVPVQQLLLTKDKGLPHERWAALWKDRRTVFASIFKDFTALPIQRNSEGVST